MPLMKWGSDCSSCGSHNHVHLFPAALLQGVAPRAEAALEGEAACFDHPGKVAVAACERCGRFVCQLCSIEMGAGVWCPSCVATPFQNNSRTLYDTCALAIPFGLLIVWPLTVLSAPAVVALALMKWTQPLSLVRRNRWRFVAGLAVALAQGGLWIWFGLYQAAKSRAGG
jgi:hypothetical protein